MRCKVALGLLAIIMMAPAAHAQTPESALGCIPLSEAKNQYTPPELSKASVACIDSAKYIEGLELNMLAGVYGRFDAFRVEDKGAHKAAQTVLVKDFAALPDWKKKEFRKYSNTFKNTRSPEFKDLCERIKAIGAPDYSPDYMLRQSKPDAKGERKLVANFDAAKAWDTALDEYLHCPKK